MTEEVRTRRLEIELVTRPRIADLLIQPSRSEIELVTRFRIADLPIQAKHQEITLSVTNVRVEDLLDQSQREIEGNDNVDLYGRKGLSTEVEG